jgi:hypothetical protein
MLSLPDIMIKLIKQVLLFLWQLVVAIVVDVVAFILSPIHFAIVVYHRLANLFWWMMVRGAYKQGRAAAERDLLPAIGRQTDRFNKLLDDIRAADDHLSKTIADMESQHKADLARCAKELATEKYNQAILIESHDSQVRELRKQLSIAQNDSEVKDKRIQGLTEVIERDRERVRHETAVATRGAEESLHGAQVARAIPSQQQQSAR